jgi:F420-dependent oxidoreductase-like protein
MRIGLLIDELGEPIESLVAQARDAAERGFPSIWLAQRGTWDALTVLTVLGREVPGVSLGTSVIPTYPRHPLALASQALTTQAATGSPLDLGVGVSHKYIIEGQHGLSFDRPARHLREYLEALEPLLKHKKADYHGETLTAAGTVEVPGTEPPSLLVGALGPATLRVTGAHADGVITSWAGARAIEGHIVPTVAEAASSAGRGSPRIVAAKSICVTADVEGRRAWIAEQYGGAVKVSSYRAIFDREGADGPADTEFIGDETVVAKRIRELMGSGATELLAMPFGSPEDRARTKDLLVSLSRG